MSHNMDIEDYERNIMQPEDWPYEVIPEPSLKHEMRAGAAHNFSASAGTSLLKPIPMGRNSSSKGQTHRGLNNSEAGSEVSAGERGHGGSERDKWNRWIWLNVAKDVSAIH